MKKERIKTVKVDVQEFILPVDVSLEISEDIEVEITDDVVAELIEEEEVPEETDQERSDKQEDPGKKKFITTKGMRGVKPVGDKILDNGWNAGTVELDELGEMTVDDSFMGKWFSSASVSDDNLEIHAKIYDICENDIRLSKLIHSEGNDLTVSENKKLPKRDLIHYYNAIREPLKEEISSEIQLFKSIAEFLEAPYVFLYGRLTTNIKEAIIKEFDSKYNLFKKKGFVKTF